MTSAPTLHPRHGVRMLAVAVIAPAVLALAAVIVLLRLAATGPARVATHWGYSGPPNGFGSPYTYPILMASISLVLIAVLGGGTVLFTHRGPLTRVIKLLAVTSTWVTVLLGVSLIASLVTQRTTAAVHQAASPGPWLLVGAVIGLALAAGGWFVLPKAVRVSAVDDSPAVPPVALTGSERASWHRTATASRRVTWLLIGLTLLVGVAELVVIYTSSGRAWPVAFVPILLMLIVLATLTWTVRIDGRGVLLRSAIGVPYFRIPLDNIVSASVVQVHAVAEYGGWGVRWNLAGRMGIILRSGEALQIHRAKGVDIVITIDDATTAAGLINALVQRGGGHA